MARITAFGQTGPLRQGPGFAAIASAFGGTWYLNGPADRPPSRPTPVYPDYLTGLFTAFGVMAALRHRDATGEGQWIDAALYESAFRILEYTTTLYGRKGVVRERGRHPARRAGRAAPSARATATGSSSRRRPSTCSSVCARCSDSPICRKDPRFTEPRGPLRQHGRAARHGRGVVRGADVRRGRREPQGPRHPALARS